MISPKPREYDRHGKRLIPLTKAVRSERRRQFRAAIGFYRSLQLRPQPQATTPPPTSI